MYGKEEEAESSVPEESGDGADTFGFGKKKKYEFNKHDPEGNHSFDLSNLCDRAILGLLLGMETDNPGR
eukprot:1189960-Prorocentrum_minimum.AAC.4